MSTEPQDRTRYCSRCLTTFDGDPEVCPNLSCRCKRKKDGWGEMLAEGDVLDRHYKIERCLAIGGAGVTYLAYQLGEDDQTVGPALAIKVLYSHRDHGAYLKRLATEAQILQELEHPNIVRTMGFVNRAGRSPYLLTRFEAGGSLLDHLRRVGPMSIRTVAGMGVQLCEALELAHEKGVIHRDLKPENILLAREADVGEVPLARLTDFGIAKVSASIGDRLTRVGAFVGTPQYAAPEQFAGREPTSATDLFSLAAVLQFCITLEPLTSPELVMDPAEALNRLDKRLPVVITEGGTPQEIASFNTFLAATTAALADERVSVDAGRTMLQAILLGDPVELAPRQVRRPAPDTMPLVLDSPSLTHDPPTGEVSYIGADDAPTSLSRDPEDTDAATMLASDMLASDLEAQVAEGVPEAAPEAAHRASAPPPPPHAVSMAPPSKTPVPAPPAPGGWTAPPLLPPLERPAPAPAPPKPKKKRGRGLMLAVGLLAFLGVIGLGAAGLAWFAVPHRLPAAVRGALPKTTLTPNNPAHAEEIQSLNEHLAGLGPGMRAACGIPASPFVLALTVEPTGRLRSVDTVPTAALPAATLSCLREQLVASPFPRRSSQPVRVALTLGL